jgi:syntaxin-binding protein 1
LQTRRVFAFVVGGLTYSEVRAAHRLSSRLGREIIVGGTSIESPASFMQQVFELGSTEHSALEIEGSGRR